MSLARSIASSSVSKVVIGATGPKISSRLIDGVGGHVDQHRRRVEEAGAAGRLAADEHLGAVVDRVGHELGDRLDGLLVDERPDVDALVLAAADA